MMTSFPCLSSSSQPAPHNDWALALAFRSFCESRLWSCSWEQYLGDLDKLPGALCSFSSFPKASLRHFSYSFSDHLDFSHF
uniref:Uncharacterized protein n=1 Tax=Arundo donax TaxID=35708 RepID=A0A0A8Y2S1_ARUDO